MRFRPDGRLDSHRREFFLQVAGEIQIDRGAEPNFLVLRAAGALLDVFPAKLLSRLALFDVQSERRIFVVHDLLVLEQFEEAIVGNVFKLLITAAVKQHREREKAECYGDEDDAAPVEARLVAVASLLVVALRVTIGLWHKGCDYGLRRTLS